MSTKIEDILEFFCNSSGRHTTRLSHSGNDETRRTKKWFDIVANHGTNQSQELLEQCVEQFLLLFMEKNVSVDIKEWMSKVKNP
jgi:hypothetical protein